MITIGIYQLLSNCEMYEHICLENTKKLYTYYGKCNDKLQFIEILEASMVSTTDRFTDNSTVSPGPTMILRKCSEIKSLRLFTEVLDFKKKTYVCRVGADKSKRKAIISGSMLWSSITKSKRHKNINEQVNKYLYNWILQHPQIVQSSIEKRLPKVSIDGCSEPQLVPKFLLQVLVQ